MDREKTGQQKIDLHLHTTASDGTDTPEELAEKVTAAGIGILSVTDHDTVKNCAVMRSILGERAAFINGVEFSCRDDKGRYHILGYAYDETIPGVRELAEHTHLLRIKKQQARLDFLEREYGFTFPQEKLRRLFSESNPGKPHIGNLMTECGFAPDKETAIKQYINQAKTPGVEVIRPEEAIRAVRSSGGIPVLAHAYFGDGSQLLSEEELERRIPALKEAGLEGLECYYSGFSEKMQDSMLRFARRYDLYVTAGSDYHGGNKTVKLGEHHLACLEEADPRLFAFLERCGV